VNAIVYDCEIEKAILGRKETRIDGIAYCEGWRDFAGMGLSVVGAYDYATDAYRVFCKDNAAEFAKLVAGADIVIGFNSLAFDDPLVKTVWNIEVGPKSYDLLAETWQAAGLSREFVYPTHLGYTLNALSETNGLGGKTGHGATAPVQWQRGQIGAVADYCLHDVWLTKQLIDKVFDHGWLLNPIDGKPLTIRQPK
jgi:hypothetical protein